jgi:serine/threonine protein kinase
MFGAGAEERLNSPWIFSFKKRVWWLEVNLATAFMAAAVVGLFEGVIQQLAILAAYMPVVAGMGGNASAQAMSVSIRGLAVGRVDRAALRLTAHEMLSGVKPWAGEGIYAIIYKQKNEELPSLTSMRPELPLHLVRVVERCLAKNREGRWSSARELLDHLQGAPVLPEEDVVVESSALTLLAPVDIQPVHEVDGPVELARSGDVHVL